MYDQVKAGLPQDICEASLLMRIVPLPILSYLMRVYLKGEVASFCLLVSWRNGREAGPVSWGRESASSYHMTRVPISPGLGVFFQQSAGRTQGLCFVRGGPAQRGRGEDDRGGSGVQAGRLMARRSMACDVLVVGSGVAGMSAGIRAAREGAHTVLMEKRDHPGGTAVTGMHRFICGLYGNGDDMPDTTLNGGIAAEVCAGLKARAPEKEVQRAGKVYVLPFASSDLVSTFRSLSEAEGGLEILYGTRAVSVAVEREAIASITAQDRGWGVRCRSERRHRLQR